VRSDEAVQGVALKGGVAMTRTVDEKRRVVDDGAHRLERLATLHWICSEQERQKTHREGAGDPRCLPGEMIPALPCDHHVRARLPNLHVKIDAGASDRSKISLTSLKTGRYAMLCYAMLCYDMLCY